MSLTFTTAAQSIAGIASKNENLINNSRLIPSIRPEEIVEPLLDIPGITVIPCIIPMIIEFFQLNSFVCSNLDEKYKSNQVISSQIPIARLFSKRDSIVFFIASPIMPVIIVARII